MVFSKYHRRSCDEYVGFSQKLVQLFGHSNGIAFSCLDITDFAWFSSDDPTTDRISDHTLVKIFDATAIISDDVDKIRTNAARIHGNILRLVNAEHIESPKWQTLCLAALRRMCDQVRMDGGSQVKNVKVKWNVCHAIGAVMKNTIMFQLPDRDFDWVVRILFSHLHEPQLLSGDTLQLPISACHSSNMCSIRCHG